MKTPHGRLWTGSAAGWARTILWRRALGLGLGENRIDSSEVSSRYPLACSVQIVPHIQNLDRSGEEERSDD